MGGKDNTSLAVMESVDGVKPLLEDLRNISKFTLDIIKIHKMVQQCDKGIGRAILTKITQLIPLRERTTWAAYQRTLEKPEPETLDNFICWITQINNECRIKA